MRRVPPLLSFGAAGMLATLLVLLFWQGRQSDVDFAAAAITVGDIVRPVVSTGTLEPVRTVDIGTQVSGTIQSLEADFNTIVRAGQVVARLDPAAFEATLTEARAELARAEARAAELTALLEDAARKDGRAGELAARELIAREESDTARAGMQELHAELKGSQAEILAAAAAVKRAEVDLSHTVIRTPIDGVVVHRHVNVGQTVAARLESPVLLTVADLRQMRLVAEIDEGEVGGVQPGTPVAFQVEALGEVTFEGQVADVRLQPYTEQVAGTAGRSTGSSPAPAATGTSGSTPSTPGTSGAPSGSTSAASTAGSAAASSTPGAEAPGIVTYRAIVDVNNDDGRLMPGGTAIVHLTSGRRQNAVRIPNAALAFAPPPTSSRRWARRMARRTSTRPSRSRIACADARGSGVSRAAGSCPCTWRSGCPTGSGPSSSTGRCEPARRS